MRRNADPCPLPPRTAKVREAAGPVVFRILPDRIGTKAEGPSGLPGVTPLTVPIRKKVPFELVGTLRQVPSRFISRNLRSTET